MKKRSLSESTISSRNIYEVLTLDEGDEDTDDEEIDEIYAPLDRDEDEVVFLDGEDGEQQKSPEPEKQKKKNGPVKSNKTVLEDSSEASTTM